MKQISNTKLIVLVVLAFVLLTLNLLIFSFKYVDTQYPWVSARASTSVSGILSLYVSAPGVCNIDLAKDWNLISMCGIPSDNSITSVLGVASGEYDYILRWNASSQSFLLWSSSASTNPFSKFELNESYFVHMTQAHSTLPLGSTTNGDMNISLLQYFNAPSYPYEFTSNLTDALASIEGNYSYVLKWNSSTQAFMLYSIFTSENPFSVFYAGEGQFINVNSSSAKLVYNRTGLVP